MGKTQRHTGSCIKEAQAAWLGVLCARNYSRSTIESYRSILNQFISFVENKALQQIGLSDIEAWRFDLIKRELAPATQELGLRTLRKFFGWLEETGQLFWNPCGELSLPRSPRKLLPVPSEKQMRQLLAQPKLATPVGQRDRALLEVAYGCGLRREELLRLDVLDVDLKSERLRVQGKGRRERVVPLGRHAKEWLGQYLDHSRPRLLKEAIDERALWISRQGGRISIPSVHAIVRRHGAAAGLRLSAHDLRRACATHMLRNGAHPVQIQLLLGHANLKHLGQYLRVSIRDLRQMHQNSKPGK